MNAVAQVQPAQGAEIVRADAGSLMDVISRAAADPNTDVDKLERLLSMYERITAREAKAAYTQALAQVQRRLPVISERGRIEIKDKNNPTNVLQSTSYAKWEDINEVIRPILHENGFTLSFRTGVAQDGKITVTGVLSHNGGHQEETTVTLPHDSSGSKNAVQAVGSSTSYGKRYATISLLNITSRGEDDDGQKGGAPATITTEQADELQAIIDSVGADKARFLRYMKVERLADLPAAKFNDALIALNKKAGR